jgi:GNAT superfamily N-acetyltransferase
MSPPITVVPLAPEHREAWERLYTGYAAFYQVEQSAAMRARVWGWLHDPAHEVEGLVALASGAGPVGLAHFRPFARPLAASIGGFLDDLFVAPEARGSGAAQALIEAVAARGRERGWTAIRWITAEDNYRGRSVYDRVAQKTKWLTYEIKLV